MIDIRGPIEVAEWLAVLTPGPLGGCLACRTSTMWHHPTAGPVHPQCIATALAVLDDGGAAPVVRVPSAAPRNRGAYSRRAAMVG